MNEILLAILGFCLGIFATLITQIISRRFKLADTKCKKKLDNLGKIKEWMEAYRTLFSCKYPDMGEFYALREIKKSIRKNPEFAKYILYDESLKPKIYQALKEYRAENNAYNEKEITGIEALDMLVGNKSLGIFRKFFSSRQFYIKTLKKRPLSQIEYYRFIEFSTHSKEYWSGFSGKIAPLIDTLNQLKRRLFKEFPETEKIHISWDKLDFTLPERVDLIISISTDVSEEMIDEYDKVSNIRDNAEKIVRQVIREINNQEEKWIVPIGEGK